MSRLPALRRRLCGHACLPKIVKNMSKILIISDVHLSEKFNPKKYQFLEKIISESDKVIINGDFWTYYISTFNQFLNSKWKGLFSLLKEKKAVYIYGNHDREKYCNESVSEFSVLQGDSYKFEAGGKSYLLARHGHDLVNVGMENSEKYMKFWRDFNMDAITYFIETILIKIFGRNVYSIGKRLNETIKEYSKKLEGIDYLVVGHTHWAEIDKGNKFINCGLIHSGFANYVVIDGAGPRLVLTTY